MGLDMYLSKNTYLGDQYRKENIVVIKTPKLKIKVDRVKNIVEEIMYWRKFNALHSFIVHNYNNGEDDWSSIKLYTKDIKEIIRSIKIILDAYNNDKQEGISVAKDIMPTSGGFFFGSTEYDENYFTDMKETYYVLKAESLDTTDFYFHFTYWASW